MGWTSSYRLEAARKAVHLSSCAIPIIYGFISAELALSILGTLLAIASLLEALRQAEGPVARAIRVVFGSMMRPSEHHGDVSGATWVLLGAMLTIAAFPKPAAICALYMLSISDTLASLVGKAVSQAAGRKTWAGSFAFLASALAIGFLTLPGLPAAAIASALAATIVEATPWRKWGFSLDDNVTVPVTGAAVISLWL